MARIRSEINFLDIAAFLADSSGKETDMKRLHLVDVGVGGAIIVLALAVVFKIGDWSPVLPHATPTAWSWLDSAEFSAALILATPTCPAPIAGSDRKQSLSAGWYIVETTAYEDSCLLRPKGAFRSCVNASNVQFGYYKPAPTGHWLSDEIVSGPYDDLRECQGNLETIQP